MKILIAGGTGFIGKAIASYLIQKKHQVTFLVRDKKQKGIYWDPENRIIESQSLKRFEVIICLNGVNITQHRWTNSFKQKIFDSRIKSVKFLSETIALLEHRPKLFVQASGISFYGDTPQKVGENAPSGNFFLSYVCRKWEKASENLVDIRRIYLRFGLVLGKEGGVLKRLLFLFRVGLGGIMGGKKTKISWISIDEICLILQHIMEHKELSGPINITHPEVVTGAYFYKTIAKILRRPCFLSFPKFMIKIVFGKMGKELFLANNNVFPQKLIDSGYIFSHPGLEKALRHLLEKK